MIDFTIGPPLGVMSKRFWSGHLSPAPHGAQVHFMVVATSNGQHQVGNMAMVLPKMDGQIHLTIECMAHNFSPPESDSQRRRRLVRQALVAARDSGRLGLTTNDEASTVDAILSALAAEFGEGPPGTDEDHDLDYNDQDDD
jgi:hypothetical protein